MRFNLPATIISVILAFADLFSKQVWSHIQIVTERAVEITTGLAVWYHTCLPVVPIRWILVHDP